MEYSRRVGWHTYFYEVESGEDLEVALITVHSEKADAEGLFLVAANGAIEMANDFPGYGPNSLRKDGTWPSPPPEALSDAAKIAAAKCARLSGR